MPPNCRWYGSFTDHTPISLSQGLRPTSLTHGIREQQVIEVTVNDGDVSECGELSREELLEGFGSNWKVPGRNGYFLFYIVFVIISLSPRPNGGGLVFVRSSPASSTFNVQVANLLGRFRRFGLRVCWHGIGLAFLGLRLDDWTVTRITWKRFRLTCGFHWA